MAQIDGAGQQDTDNQNAEALQAALAQREVTLQGQPQGGSDVPIHQNSDPVSDESEILRSHQPLTGKCRVPCRRACRRAYHPDDQRIIRQFAVLGSANGLNGLGLVASPGPYPLCSHGREPTLVNASLRSSAVSVDPSAVSTTGVSSQTQAALRRLFV